MIGVFITFLVLFGMIKIFERKRDDLDNFNIATVAIVPVLCAVLVRVALGFLVPDAELLLLLPGLVLIGTTFGLLWKNLEIPLGRSMIYTVVVAIVNEVQVFLFSPS